MTKAMDELQELIREIAERNARDIEAAEKAGLLREVIRDEEMYGPFPGGDPRDFSPDPECATEDEIKRHAEACSIANETEIGRHRPPQCQLMGDGSNMRRQGFGLGVTKRKVKFLQIVDESGNVIEELF